MDISTKILNTLSNAAAQKIDPLAAMRSAGKLLSGVNTSKLQPLSRDMLEIRGVAQKAAVVSSPYSKTGVLEAAKEAAAKN